MRVLFICKGNVGRSQMGAAFLKVHAGNEIEVASAGTEVGENEGAGLHEFVIEVMDEKGIDLSSATRRQLTEEMVTNADKIIVTLDTQDVPRYLARSEKAEFWNIPDAKGRSLEFHRTIRGQIENKVTELAKRL